MEADGETPPPPSPELLAAVLGNDDILREILLRLGFPTYLVSAVLVSKRWLRHASDPDFLRRFRARNPRRLLGFCASRHFVQAPRFVPLPQPPELAAPLRCAATSLDGPFADASLGSAFANRYTSIMDCRNGRILLKLIGGRVLLMPLQMELPRPPALSNFDAFLPEDGGPDGTIVVTLKYVGRNPEHTVAELFVLRSGSWGVPTTAEMELPEPGTDILELLPPIHGKVLMKTNKLYALELDLVAARLSILQLPDGVGVEHNFRLSRAGDSGLYLVHGSGSQLNVWLQSAMNGDWALMDTFSVSEACSLADPNWDPENQLTVVAVGDNAECVFLHDFATGSVFYVHRKSRMVQKVFQGWHAATALSIFPFMMVWPPVFPALNGGRGQEE